MANRAYLCQSDHDSLYPSFVDEEYDSAAQTLASDVEAVPLLWLALFRPQNLRQQTFEVDGEEITVEAPIVERATALAQLEESRPYFNSLFEAAGSLDDYYAFFRQLLESATGKYVTIELQEVATLYEDEQQFYDEVRAALAAIGSPVNEEDQHRLMEICQLPSNLKFPSARMYLDHLDYSDDDQWAFTRVLGAGQFGSLGIGKEVPWECEDADFRFEFIPFDGDEDDDFEDDEDFDDDDEEDDDFDDDFDEDDEDDDDDDDLDTEDEDDSAENEKKTGKNGDNRKK